MKEELINKFLYFGYPVEKEYELPFDLDLLSYKKMKSYSESELVEEGSNVLKKVFREECSDIDLDKTHVIPLSGGLDSRAILGGLIDEGLRDQIVAVTFGIPGTWDYELSSEVAKEANVRHESLDLRKIKITTDKLMDTLRNTFGSKYHFLIDLFYNRLINKKFGKQSVYWPAYGDAFAGFDLSNKQKSFRDAKEKFAHKNNKTTNKFISHPEFDPLEVLPDEPLCEPTLLSFLDQLDFGIRQPKYIKPMIIQSEYETRTPFLNDEWIKFILNVPIDFRKNEILYRKILMKTWPKLFDIPTASNKGLPLKVSNHRWILWMLYIEILRFAKRSFPYLPLPLDPGVNYIDFDEAIRSRLDYKELVKNNLRDLKNRDIVDWIDFESMWRDHLQREENLANELLLLAILEINLKLEDLG